MRIATGVGVQAAVDRAPIKLADLEPIEQGGQILQVEIVRLIVQNGQQLVRDPPGGVVLFQGQKGPGAAAILGRRGPCTAATEWIDAQAVQRQDALKAELMLPEVAEVVLVVKRALMRRRRSESRTCRGSSAKQMPPSWAMP